MSSLKCRGNGQCKLNSSYLQKHFLNEKQGEKKK